MLYTQTSLSLVYNLERVSKNLHCYSATYQFGIVAWLRLEPTSYSTKLYSLHRRCSFGPVAVALRAALWVVRAVSAFLLLGVVCVALDLLLGVVDRQMSLSLRAGRAALAEDMGMMSEEADLCDVLPAVWCEKTTTLQAQRTSFNTLDNWGHKTPTQSKRKKDRKEKVKGS